MGDKVDPDHEFFCSRSQFLSSEIILMDKENLYTDKHNSLIPRTRVTPEPPTESLSFFSDNSNFLLPPFSAGPKNHEKTWDMTSPVVGNGGSLVPSPPITPIGRNVNHCQVKIMNGQGQNRNFTAINPPNSLPSVHRGTMWGQPQRDGGNFGNGGYVSDVTPGMAWGSPQVQNQRRSYGGVDVGAVGYGGGIKRERAGTGVFLPRTYQNTAPESRKKTGGSTTRPQHVQAQNRKFENVTPQLPSQRHFIASGHIPQNNSEPVMTRRDVAFPQEWRKNEMAEAAISNPSTASAEGMTMDNEIIKLPREWTY